MSRRTAWFLLAAAGWTAYVWISRLYLMAGSDDSVGFKVVHGVLAVISLGFGVGIAWVGIRALRATGSPGSTPREPETAGDRR